MADGKKWFKVWTSILSDPTFDDLPNEYAGIWVKLGALVAMHGCNGNVTVTKSQFLKRTNLPKLDKKTLTDLQEHLSKINVDIVETYNGNYENLSLKDNGLSEKLSETEEKTEEIEKGNVGNLLLKNNGLSGKLSEIDKIDTPKTYDSIGIDTPKTYDRKNSVTGNVTVTFKKWRHYQENTDSYMRVKRFRERALCNGDETRYMKQAHVTDKEKEKEKEKEKKKKPSIPEESIFSSLWEKYPNKDGKKTALIHFQASVITEEDIINIQKALDNYLASERVKKGYVKNGATWFNNWRDWIDMKPAKRWDEK